MHEPAELADGYWKHYRACASSIYANAAADAAQWAWDEVEERVRSRPEEMVAVLVVIADAAPDDAALAYLGAGPVEDLIVYHGSDVVIDRIEGAARRNENFRKAVRCAWFDDDVHEAVGARLRAFGDPY